MILEHGKLNPVATTSDGKWLIKQVKQYRWLDADKKPVSEWFEGIDEALDWIIKHDKEKQNETI